MINNSLFLIDLLIHYTNHKNHTKKVNSE